jgi:hypothetical protein
LNLRDFLFPPDFLRFEEGSVVVSSGSSEPSYPSDSEDVDRLEVTGAVISANDGIGVGGEGGSTVL